MPFCASMLAWVISMVLCTIYPYYRIPFAKCAQKLFDPALMFSSNCCLVTNPFVSIACENLQQFRSVSNFFQQQFSCCVNCFFPLSKNTFHYTVWYTSKFNLSSLLCPSECSKAIAPFCNLVMFLFRLPTLRTCCWHMVRADLQHAKATTLINSTVTNNLLYFLLNPLLNFLDCHT